jgi:hypothetical protein
MADHALHTRSHPTVVYRPGDLVASQANTYPVLLEVIGIEVDGQLRVRGVGWAPGYSVLLARDQVRQVSSILPRT